MAVPDSNRVRSSSRDSSDGLSAVEGASVLGAVSESCGVFLISTMRTKYPLTGGLMPAPKVNELTVTVEQVQLMGLDVLNWRYECLEEAGYPVDAAIALAERAGVDLHEACGLLASGASVEQALRILT